MSVNAWTDEDRTLARAYVDSASFKVLIAPSLAQMHAQMMIQLKSPPNARPEPKFSDDFLRGAISGLEFALGNWEKRLQEYDAADKKQDEKQLDNQATENPNGTPYVETT